MLDDKSPPEGRQIQFVQTVDIKLSDMDIRKNYDKTLGYANFTSVDQLSLYNKSEIIKNIIEPFKQFTEDSKILVAGCGDGREADIVQQVFGSWIEGVDVMLEKESKSKNGRLITKRWDLAKLPYEEDAFDLVYSYHVLEHVTDHLQVLCELKRVVKHDGIIFIGFPNKNRIAGYIGTHNKETILNKLTWNLIDYKARLLGKFENYYGAHAGFTNRLFIKECKELFKEIYPVRNEYMLLKHQKYSILLNMLISTGFSEFFFPSNYYVLKK